jgi:hypothetical protein
LDTVGKGAPVAAAMRRAAWDWPGRRASQVKAAKAYRTREESMVDACGDGPGAAGGLPWGSRGRKIHKLDIDILFSPSRLIVDTRV